jgi:hypothetical protein
MTFHKATTTVWSEEKVGLEICGKAVLLVDVPPEEAPRGT